MTRSQRAAAGRGARSWPLPKALLEPLISPRSVVLIAERPSEFPAAEIAEALRGADYQGRLSTIQLGRVGLRTMPHAELGIVSVTAPRVGEAVEACRNARCRAVLILNGPEGDLNAKTSASTSLPKSLDLARFAILGPNSQGIISVPGGLSAGTGSLFGRRLHEGPVSVVTQSGFGHAVVTLGHTAGLGFRYVLATGNEAGLDVLDCASLLLERDDVEFLWVLAEGIREGRRLLSLGARAASMGKPVLVWITGRSAAGRVAAASHTGSLVSDLLVLQAGLRSSGLLEVHGEDELIDATRALATGRRARSNAVGVVSVSGGAGVALADCLAEAGMALPALSSSTVEELSALVPTSVSIENPLDVRRTATRSAQAYASTIGAMARDRRIGQLILHHGAIGGPPAEALAKAVSSVARRTRKPIMVITAAPAHANAAAITALGTVGIPMFESVQRAAVAASFVRVYGGPASALRANREPSRLHPARLRNWHGSGEQRAERLIESYGIPVARSMYLRVDGGVPVVPRKWKVRFPVAVKLDTPTVKQRSRLGLVRTSVSSEADALLVIADLLRRAERLGAAVVGIVVQEMVQGLEVFLGGGVDPSFGPFVGVGAGGPFVESISQPVFRLAPLSLADAESAVRESNLVRALARPQIFALANALTRLSWLVDDYVDSIREIDINPLFVADSGVLAADATVIPAG